MTVTRKKPPAKAAPPAKVWTIPGSPYPGEIDCFLPAEHPGQPHTNVRYGLTWEEDE
ncbi:hypothetical protein [Nonomuraea aurantiaca]|uniref:hypothetical protein n=1 Tax=Nonomuraea aurantiaca TaxID=2878562 RepID=UPI001CD93E1C|nr:hypothetical protein [Nonomuraea aurantiaca]MCA2225147.1 hypothetical protein [Nonomuraea aurantiaca]